MVDYIGLNFAELVQLAVKEKCEVDINIEPDHAEVSLRPWEPYHYQCPYVCSNVSNTPEE